jgi:DNA adenine methylase
MTASPVLPPGRTFLRYLGGKARIAPLIIAQMPPHKVYTEAFGGGAGVLLQKPPAMTDVYNDLDHDVFNVFRQMRDAGPRLGELLELTPYSREEHELCYQPTVDPLEAARRFIFRAAAGIGADSARRNGGFRTGLNRELMSTAGTWRNTRELWPVIVERLKHVLIENRPAVEVLTAFDGPRTLHLIDPPYVHTTRRDTGRRYAEEMKDADHEELAAVVHRLKGMCMVCGYDSRLYRRLYKGWRRAEFQARDNANGARTEVVWFSPNIPVPEPELFPATFEPDAEDTTWTPNQSEKLPSLSAPLPACTEKTARQQNSQTPGKSARGQKSK